MTTPSRSPLRRYAHPLWLLSARDLRVRYSTSALGYLWSVLDPLLMSLIYWFIFTQVFSRGVGAEPYIVFLLSALLPCVWFNAAVGEFTRAFLKDAKLYLIGARYGGTGRVSFEIPEIRLERRQ